ncbi:hypothetical protein [Tellurirhabdus rosea]|uniref:hypothetical protein n=1 Tax=Tellurirhabdus rosea TaxID=2674997 RepID=UPI0022553CAE|nr:hypothetical protein [Tellurirhabdus rosea]
MDLIRLEGDLQLAEMRYNADKSDSNKERLDVAKAAYEKAAGEQESATKAPETPATPGGTTTATGSGRGQAGRGRAATAAPATPAAPASDEGAGAAEDASKKNTAVS